MARLQSEMQRQAASLKTKNKNPNQMEEVCEMDPFLLFETKRMFHCEE